MADLKTSPPLTAERIRAVAGDLSDGKVLDILKLDPTERDLLEARMVQSEGVRPSHAHGAASSVAARIVEILVADEEADEESP